MRVALLMTVSALVLVGCESDGMMGMKDQSHKHIVVAPDQIKWEAGPAGLPAGSKFVVLEGDPSKSAFFTLRASFPDGYRIAPHYHSAVERVTVISGTFYLGQGDRFDESKGQLLPAGSYVSMPPGMHHFAWSKGETVVQISTIGPWDITYINPQDDPRKTSQ